jgi:hypothetical protein
MGKMTEHGKRGGSAMDRRGFIVTGAAALMSGCVFPKFTSRSQRPEPEAEVSGLPKTVGDVSVFDNVVGIPISGVGLVTGLDGTGGGSPPGDLRKMLEDYLKIKHFENYKAILESPAHAMVLVSSIIPAGTRKGDPINLEITLPPQSRVKSLRGGYLTQTRLVNFDTTGNVRENMARVDIAVDAQKNDNRLLLGSPLAWGEGPIHGDLKPRVIKSGKTNEKEEERDLAIVKHGWIWSGAKAELSRPFFLVMNPEHQRFRMAIQIAERINETFQSSGPANEKLSEAKTKEVVGFLLPPHYRLNLPHFLRVVRAIPIDRLEEDQNYRKQLEQKLAEPATCMSAALRLEAIGRKSVPVLKGALTSNYPMVRFAAAHALAYLGEPAAANELGVLAQDHPSLQAYTLTALGSMGGEAASVDKLADLCGSESPEVRYGAFRALRASDPSLDLVRADRIQTGIQPTKDQPEVDPSSRSFHHFWLHQVPTGVNNSMVHLLTGQRAEIVLFGEKRPTLIDGCSLSVGEFTVTTRRGDSLATISRFSTRKGHAVEQSPLTLSDVIRTIARLGAMYTEVVELLQKADQIKSLSCPLVVDAMPKALSVKQLAELGRDDPEMNREIEMLGGQDDMGGTPTLFDRSTSGTDLARNGRF